MKVLVKRTIQFALIFLLVSCSLEKESMYEACLRVEMKDLLGAVDPYAFRAGQLGCKMAAVLEKKDDVSSCRFTDTDLSELYDPDG